MKYRRAKAPGSAFFFTVVTFDRRKIFTDEQAVALLRRAIEVVRARRPIKVEAAVILPDHLHMIWRLPDGDGNRVKSTVDRVTTTYIGNTFEWTGSTSTMKKY